MVFIGFSIFEAYSFSSSIANTCSRRFTLSSSFMQVYIGVGHLDRICYFSRPQAWSGRSGEAYKQPCFDQSLDGFLLTSIFRPLLPFSRLFHDKLEANSNLVIACRGTDLTQYFRPFTSFSSQLTYRTIQRNRANDIAVDFWFERILRRTQMSSHVAG